MDKAVVMGVGQLGAVFAEGLLKNGCAVFPLLRRDTFSALGLDEDPQLIVVAVGEDDITSACASLPAHLAERLVLLSNELRPVVYKSFQKPPCVCIVWFEKKPGRPVVEVRPSVVFGPESKRLLAVFDRLGLSAWEASSKEVLHHELSLKNLYILGLNLFGLKAQQSGSELRAGQLLSESQFPSFVDELIELEQKLLLLARETTILDRAKLHADLKAAILADPDHGAAGRSAPARLRRTFAHMQSVDLRLPILTNLATQAP